MMGRKILLAVLCFVCISGAMAQDIKKKYRSMSNSEGSVYFINPNKGFKSDQSPKELEYDITCLTSRDSATYNFTFYSKLAIPTDSVTFVLPDQSLTLPASMLFLDPDKKNLWKNRVSVQVPYVFLETIYASPDAYQLLVIAKDQKYTFTIGKKEWQKQSVVVSKIFQVIELNK